MTEIGQEAVPRLAVGVRTRFDPARQQWMILAPERVFVPDEIALEIINRCDGAATVAAIVDDLARTFDAPRDEIMADVTTLLLELRAKGVIAT